MEQFWSRRSTLDRALSDSQRIELHVTLQPDRKDTCDSRIFSRDPGRG